MQDGKKSIVFVKQTGLLSALAYLCRTDHRVAEVSYLKPRQHNIICTLKDISIMSPTVVNKALDDFRRGDMIRLIAMDAAEVGVDVAECSFVVRFNRFGTTKSHIQGSGRGR